MTKVVFELLTPRRLTSRQDGELVLRLWKKHLPDLLPDRFGNDEPIREKFDPDHLEAALAAWQWPFLAVKKKPAMYSSIWMRKGTQPLHAAWGLSADSKSVEQDALLNLLREASTALEADFACVHSLTALELERGLASDTVLPLNINKPFNINKPRAFTFGIGSHKLQRRIPELYWATLFGPPYVEMFGRERLLSAPVLRVESLGVGRVLLQLSPQLGDLDDRWTEVERVRITAKAHLGLDAFFQPGAESSTNYRVPQFALQVAR